jgi:hypothetical protein
MECFEGSQQPLRGWVGAAGDNAVAAPLVEFRYPSREGGAVVSAVLPGPSKARRARAEVRGAGSILRGAVRHLGRPPDGARLTTLREPGWRCWSTTPART